MYSPEVVGIHLYSFRGSHNIKNILSLSFFRNHIDIRVLIRDEEHLRSCHMWGTSLTQFHLNRIKYHVGFQSNNLSYLIFFYVETLCIN